MRNWWAKEKMWVFVSRNLDGRLRSERRLPETDDYITI